MKRSSAQELNELVEFARTYPAADFYREKWESANSFADLPTISRSDLIGTPLARRLYGAQVGMVKIVRGTQGSILVAVGIRRYSPRAVRRTLFAPDGVSGRSARSHGKIHVVL